MNIGITEPRVFASYSWRPDTNKEKVKQIIDRLISDGIDVVIDIYDLNVGHDKYTYMERMVNDPTITKVLIFSNKEYSEKANSKKEGVGTESIIISKEVYGNVKQEKFIPIALQKDDENKPYFPIFISSNIYIDLSNEDTFEDEYTKLVKIVYGKPIDRKPPLGKRPFYIDSEDPIQIKIDYKKERFKSAVLEGKKNVELLIDDYLEYFFESLIAFSSMKKNNSNSILDEEVMDLINLSKIRRDDFLNYYEILIMLDEQSYWDKLHKFLERWFDYGLYFESNGENYVQREFLKFFVKELYLYMIAISINKEKFRLTNLLINSLFWIKESNNKYIYSSYTCFRFYISSLDGDRIRRLKSDRLSLATDLLISRIDYKSVNLKDLQDADVFLYCLSLIKEFKNGHDLWFPYLSMYHVSKITIMEKAESKEFFDKIKGILNVNDVHELKEKISKIPEYKLKIYQYGYNLVKAEFGFNIDNLAKY